MLISGETKVYGNLARKMLVKADLHFAYRLLSFFSLLAFFPFAYDPRTRSLKFPRSKLRRVMFLTTFWTISICALNTTLSFLGTLVFVRPGLEHVNGIVVQWVFAWGYLVCAFWALELFLVRPRLAAWLFNHCNSHLQGKMVLVQPGLALWQSYCYLCHPS